MKIYLNIYFILCMCTWQKGSTSLRMIWKDAQFHSVQPASRAHKIHSFCIFGKSRSINLSIWNVIFFFASFKGTLLQNVKSGWTVRPEQNEKIILFHIFIVFGISFHFEYLGKFEFANIQSVVNNITAATMSTIRFLQVLKKLHNSCPTM